MIPKILKKEIWVIQEEFILNDHCFLVLVYSSKFLEIIVESHQEVVTLDIKYGSQVNPSCDSNSLTAADS